MLHHRRLSNPILFCSKKSLSLAFLSSNSLSTFFLFFRIIRLENPSFVYGENLFTNLITFLTLFNTFFPFIKSLVPAYTIRVSSLFLTSSSTSPEMVSVVPPRKFFILACLSFDSPFSFMPFNNESPVIITLVLLAGFSVSIVVFLY